MRAVTPPAARTVAESLVKRPGSGQQPLRPDELRGQDAQSQEDHQPAGAGKRQQQHTSRYDRQPDEQDDAAPRRFGHPMPAQAFTPGGVPPPRGYDVGASPAAQATVPLMSGAVLGRAGAVRPGSRVIARAAVLV